MTSVATAQDLRAEQRTFDILALVRVAFAEKGFDGASMQDLARAAGMSVGNFYRYFPSKAAIVEQLIAHDLAEMEGHFAEIMTSPFPLLTLKQQVALQIQLHQECVDGQIWAEITAAALRKPEIAQAADRMEASITANLMQVFARETGLPLAEITKRFQSHASYIVLLVKAASMQAPRAPEARDALNTLILNTIDQMLAEVARASLKVK
ncbi:TetR/AcrR family transcriptional regulator [Cypionkella sp.]|jgi:AcrR family transcriptional regulator|uniref:TetR/AcrR family transcriptional regulator n=1 Tax=Cypionkella sp. TaxID=2811411 RepID=UPI00276EAFAA|nr:TetR/AcrR family transcriptional regulator [Cypionkella sp.]